MKPLIVLIIAFGVALVTIKIGWRHYDFALAARIAMTVMLLFTSMGHFKFPKGMAMMVPGFVPFKQTLVYLTGLFEIIAAITLQFSNLRVTTGWLLVVFFLLMLPANINAAIKRIDYEKGTYEGKGIKYLWFRVPLQILFIAWVYLGAIRF
ncbi:MAG TPA: hypothetical protein VFE53_26140 [Mucilaginibacter sp.]|jgi:uncharacterized membrane protein|nr:hypothetical protein [Mucilaginibacter sp.]